MLQEATFSLSFQSLLAKKALHVAMEGERGATMSQHSKRRSSRC